MKLPEGERFYSLEDSKRLKQFIVKAFEVFNDYSYINLPTIEVYYPSKDPVYTIGACGDANILSLRRDFTVSTARFLSSYRNLEVPCKVFYAGNVFSPIEGETFQIGLELLGYSSVESDAQVLLDIWSYLKSCGINKLSVSIGHASIVKKLLNSYDNYRNLFRAFLEKNFYELREYPKLCYLLRYQGQEEFLKDCLKLYPEVEKEIYELLEISKYIKNIDYVFDLSEVREQDYYTGVVFEFFVQDYGYPIAGGGRYDDLYKNFQLDLKAVGCAVYVDRMLEL